MVQNIEHIGIAVNSFDDHIPFYRDVLCLELKYIKEVPELNAEVALFQSGSIKFELIKPSSKNCAVARFIETRGEGMHHIAYHTDETLQDSAQRVKIAFIHTNSECCTLADAWQDHSRELA